MKTSTKLLIVFFLALPTTLFAYNWLMKIQYMAGNLLPEPQSLSNDLSDTVMFVKKTLPQCKYVVVSGDIASGDFEHRNYRSVFSPDKQIYIHGDHAGQQLALVNKYYESLFNTKMVNDTLYVYFYRQKRIGNISSSTDALLGLYLNSNVEYIRAGSANITLTGSFNLKHMDIKAIGGFKFDIDSLQTDHLNFIARGDEAVTLNHAKNISTFSYSLFNGAALEFNDCSIATYKPLHIDTSAKLNITIKGDAIAQYLATKH
jgi:hypothetical protein